MPSLKHACHTSRGLWCLPESLHLLVRQLRHGKSCPSAALQLCHFGPEPCIRNTWNALSRPAAEPRLPDPKGFKSLFRVEALGNNEDSTECCSASKGSLHGIVALTDYHIFDLKWFQDIRFFFVSTCSCLLFDEHFLSFQLNILGSRTLK